MDKGTTIAISLLVGILAFIAGLETGVHQNTANIQSDEEEMQETTAYFTWAPLHPKPGETVQFEDLSFGDAEIVEWHWDFGNGITNDNIRNPVVQLPEPKTEFGDTWLWVKLTVVDENGNTAKWTDIVGA